MKRRLFLVLLLLFVLPALACNMPTAPRSATPDTQQAIEKTLAVVIGATSTPPAAETGQTPVSPQPDAPLPGLPIVTVVAPTSPSVLNGNTFQYITQPGDTLAALALRFGVSLEQIQGAEPPSATSLLSIGERLNIPNTLTESPDPTLLMPDSEVMYSPSTVGFSVSDLVQGAGGFLSTYTEKVDNDTLTGAQIIQRVAQETSINPRLLLGVLEYRAHWVYGSPAQNSNLLYPIGFYADQYSGLYKEMTLVARQLTLGYYGWRSGQVTELEFANHARRRIHPVVNAGTAALQYLLSKLYDPAQMQTELYGPARFLAFYQARFGDFWQRDAALGPLLPDNLAQPDLELPFPSGETWTLTGGPHAAWGVGSPWGGLDFAPASVEKGCAVSSFWAVAAAPGLVVRSGYGQVLEDLDSDGHEQTGWVLLYLHVADKDRVPVGTVLKTGDRVGHPSCEGGFATGTHVHISRKYNGEWLAADAPLPFVLSGWQAWTGSRQYSGKLTREGQVVTARVDNVRTSLISH